MTVDLYLRVPCRHSGTDSCTWYWVEVTEMQLCLLGGSEFYFFPALFHLALHSIKLKLTINLLAPELFY